MASSAPRRYEHSVRVSEMAGELARVYGVDEFQARAAGYLHDWCKQLSLRESLEAVCRLHIPIAGDPVQAFAVLHGPIAEQTLPELFPQLAPAVFSAIGRHTIAALDMSDLDMVIFVADAIEPGRSGAWAEDLRSLVGHLNLTQLFFRCFSEGLTYVIQGGRYIYPTAIDIYNHYALLCKSSKQTMKGKEVHV
ncbi:bis(5'-nucleosyl)-tetraphosphatase (symmetrical) YqeK [Collinsella sp. AGMB00827]|uniref:bis(5'-nucleosyl)-tetraphosphatase (symmetrical) n=2 Tax=Collinsella ureilytica TaxID=2869515 RepID=A0ABS7ML76_9ACTN|nr:bis(5'-nucleosyl)-tetraphosphatase (symmetrical) YqeK [Collinsella urealyticum]